MEQQAQQQQGDPQAMLNDAIQGTAQSIEGFTSFVTQIPNAPQELAAKAEHLKELFASLVQDITQGMGQGGGQPQSQDAMAAGTNAQQASMRG